MLILVDVPNTTVPDTAVWRDRRKIASEWLAFLQAEKKHFPFESIRLLYFENTGSNNADFPGAAYDWSGDAEQAVFDTVRAAGEELDFQTELAHAHIMLALTHFSATAPLKMLARKTGVRAASMPGFSRAMIPALGLDYEVVHQHVMNIKHRLDRTERITFVFECQGRTFDFVADTRHRTAHASSGLLREPGIATNLPSGESFIVPYEGELDETSQTAGLLPVQFGDEIVIYRIENNRVVAIESEGQRSNAEGELLQTEPAYGNIAEIGFGVLRPFGIKPTGVTLLDEKLGLHIAFGRSDHFGGNTSPQDFNDPKNVVHIDRVYIPEVQPAVQVRKVAFHYEDGTSERIIRDDEYEVL